MIADQRRDRLAAAGVRHIIHLADVNAYGLCQQTGQHVIGAAGRAARDGVPAGVLLPCLDEVGEILEWGCRGHHQDLVLARQTGDGSYLPQRYRRLVGEHRAHHDQSHRHQNVSIALVGVHKLRQPDGAAGAGNVHHLGGADQMMLLQDLLHFARGLVPASARSRGSDDGQHLELGRGWACQSRRQHQNCDPHNENCVFRYFHLKPNLIDLNYVIPTIRAAIVRSPRFAKQISFRVSSGALRRH